LFFLISVDRRSSAAIIKQAQPRAVRNSSQGFEIILPVPAFPVYLFDVDGTLLKSAPDICGALQTIFINTEHNNLSQEFLQTYIGRHLDDLFYYLYPNATAEDTARLLADYRQTYLARRHASTEVYPGVAEALSKLKGRKSTATTKGTPTTRAVLEQFGLIAFFDHVQGTDGFPAKPHPDVVFKALEGLGAQPEDCLFVGDSASDMEAAKRAGVRSCAVTYGYGHASEMARWEPDYVINDLRELLPAVS
jgi:2-phosphoglycolate phosphatase